MRKIRHILPLLLCFLILGCSRQQSPAASLIQKALSQRMTLVSVTLPEAPMILWKPLQNHEPYASGYGNEAFFTYKNDIYAYVPVISFGDADPSRKAVLLKKADPASFEQSNVEYDYGRDKKFVYYNDEVLKGANPKTFKPFEFQWGLSYGADEHAIYFTSKKIENADATTFMPFSYFYAQDKNHVYYKENPIKNADIKTWMMIDDYYSKDDKNVYGGNDTMPGRDPGTFKVFASPFQDYTEDSHGVYYRDKKIEGVDMASFQPLENDGDNLLIYDEYAKDRFHVYYHGTVLSPADPATFSPPPK